MTDTWSEDSTRTPSMTLPTEVTFSSRAFRTLERKNPTW